MNRKSRQEGAHHVPQQNNNNYGSAAAEAVATAPSSTDDENVVANGKHNQQQQHSMKGIVFIMMGAFSFSIMFLLVKLMGPDANTFTLVLYRSLVQIAISLITLLYHNENPLGPRDVRMWLIVRGVFGSAAVCAWFFGIQILPLPDAVTLQFTTPPFAAAFAVCLVGEKWLPLDMIGAVVCLTGVALIAHPTWLFGKAGAAIENDDESNESSVLLKALAVMITEAGAAMAGIAYVSVRKIGHRTSAVVMVLYYGALSVPMCILGSGWLEGTWNVWGDASFTITDYFILFLMGVAGYGGQWFTNLGLQHESAATATLATSTQIVWTYIFELLFLHEALNLWSLAGTGLIMGYMLVVGAIKMINSSGSSAPPEESEPLLKEIHVAEEIDGV